MDTHHTNNHEHTRIDSQMHFRIKVPELHSKRAITPRGLRGWSNRHSFFSIDPPATHKLFATNILVLANRKPSL